MRDYDLMLILKPELAEEGVTGATDRVGGWITAGGGQVVTVTPAGRKRLAYPIKHSRDGSYVVLQIQTRPDALPEVERSLKLYDDVLRYSFIRK